MEMHLRRPTGHRRGRHETAAWIAKEKLRDVLKLRARDLTLQALSRSKNHICTLTLLSSRVSWLA
jgi:hypothetical protein